MSGSASAITPAKATSTIGWPKILVIAVVFAVAFAFVLKYVFHYYLNYNPAVAWVTTAGMAFYAIKRRQIPVHREWMVRSYVVTFAFVTFRILFDMGPTSHLQPPGDRAVSAVWASWALPLLATEVILQLKRMHRELSAPR